MYNGNRLNDTADIAGRIWIRETQNFSDPFDPDPEHCPLPFSRKFRDDGTFFLYHIARL